VDVKEVDSNLTAQIDKEVNEHGVDQVYINYLDKLEIFKEGDEDYSKKRILETSEIEKILEENERNEASTDATSNELYRSSYISDEDIANATEKDKDFDIRMKEWKDKLADLQKID